MAMKMYPSEAKLKGIVWSTTLAVMHWNPSPHYRGQASACCSSVFTAQPGHQAVALLGGPPVLAWEVWAQGPSNSIAGLPLQQHCWASTQAFFLPPLLYSGSDPHQPSSSVLVFSVSLLVRALIPPRGWHLHDPIFSQGPLTLEIRASTFQCWRVTFSSYQLPTKKISVILISYQN